jgi:hypothetical protein
MDFVISSPTDVFEIVVVLNHRHVSNHLSSPSLRYPILREAARPAACYEILFARENLALGAGDSLCELGADSCVENLAIE